MKRGERIVFLNTIFNKATIEIHFRLKLYALNINSNYLEQHSVNNGVMFDPSSILFLAAFHALRVFYVLVQR